MESTSKRRIKRYYPLRTTRRESRDSSEAVHGEQNQPRARALHRAVCLNLPLKHKSAARHPGKSFPPSPSFVCFSPIFSQTTDPTFPTAFPTKQLPVPHPQGQWSAEETGKGVSLFSPDSKRGLAKSPASRRIKFAYLPTLFRWKPHLKLC